MTASTLRAAELAAMIARHSTLPPHQIAAHVTHLQRIARQLKAIAERQCNGYFKQVPDVRVGGEGVYLVKFRNSWDAVAEGRDNQRYAALTIRARKLCMVLDGADSAAVLRFQAKVGGDPRGPCLRLLIEGERGDGWDASSDGTGSFAIY